eukprot:Hpha_TRINITY_DN1344_c0_g1::TRINITY_DN1344_c0_g1_i2::g.93417::m.93417
MIAFNAGRCRFQRIRMEPLPIAWMPYVVTPFAFAYQIDFSYGSKLERLNIEAQNIIKNEKHWFNKPLRLPKVFQQEYLAMQGELLQKCPEEPPEDWATFDDELTREEIHQLTLPATLFMGVGHSAVSA